MTKQCSGYVNGSNVLTLTDGEGIGCGSGSSVVNTASVIGGWNPSTTQNHQTVTTDVHRHQTNLLISKSGITGIEYELAITLAR